MASKQKRNPVAPLQRVISESDKINLKMHFTNKKVELMTRDEQLDHCCYLAELDLKPNLWNGLNSDQIKRQVSLLMIHSLKAMRKLCVYMFVYI